jgi:membrane-associated protein
MIPAILHPAMGLLPGINVEQFLQGSGGWALVIVCGFIFAETGLLVGFVLPGDTLLIITGVLTFSNAAGKSTIPLPIWLVCLLVAVSAWLGGKKAASSVARTSSARTRSSFASAASP